MELLRRFSSKVFLFIFLVAAGAVISAHLFFPQFQVFPLKQLTLKSGSWFTSEILHIHNFFLMDLGVVDANGDGNLDLFTINHDKRQSLLLGDGQGIFNDDVLSDWGLDQNRNFPGWENQTSKPKIDTPGLYIYQGPELTIRTHQLEDINAIQGQIQRIGPGISIITNDLFDVEFQEETLPTGLINSILDFTTSTDSSLVVDLKKLASMPLLLKLDESIPLERVFVGHQKIHPSSHKIVLQCQDRHGMAWADYDGDSDLDVFISRGAIKGRIQDYPYKFNEELMTRQGLRFSDLADARGIVKDSCPGRQVAWNDVNKDGLLDLYVVCGRRPPNQSPNQLFMQQFDGTFVNVAENVGLAIPGDGIFAWLDVEGDGDSDLLWVNRKGTYELYINNAGKFKPHSINSSINSIAAQLSVADYDNDGDPDVFVASYQGNTLLVNDNGDYKSVQPRSLGLADRSRAASWVDYDNDGLTDLYILPNGLYRQTSDHKFVAAKLLSYRFLSRIFDGRSNWVDVDNDGDRDLIIGVRFNKPLWKKLPLLHQLPFGQNIDSWRVELYRNVESKKHWLEVKLIGSNTNRQAIGARVTVTTPNGEQLQQVGQNEGTRYSQGHYRLYFGLGTNSKAHSVRVTWADGTIQDLANVEADRILTITKKE